jgi:hypothetical protein
MTSVARIPRGHLEDADVDVNNIKVGLRERCGEVGVGSFHLWQNRVQQCRDENPSCTGNSKKNSGNFLTSWKISGVSSWILLKRFS